MIDMRTPKTDMGGVSGGALEGLRVLDLTNASGNYCGKLFADLGADVILIEPPEGTELRHRGPYVEDRPSSDGSLLFLYFNSNKRSISLDLDSSDGRNTLLRLVATADLLIETSKPGTMARRGLGYETLRSIRPSLVYTSISPFGQTGPYAHFEADDLTAMAMGGLLAMAGYPDAAPLVAYGEQAFAAASLFGAVASLMAILRAEASGDGEYIDVSIQEAVSMGLENAAQAYTLEGTVRRRQAGPPLRAGSGLYPCKDGYVYMLAGGIGETKFWNNFLNWMTEEGIAEAATFHDPRWLDLEFLVTDEARRLFVEWFGPFAARHTKLELYEKARHFRVPMAPASTPADVFKSAQLRHRGFFVESFHPGLKRTLRFPGAPYKLSDSPWRLRLPAPCLGEHNDEVFCEIGLGSAPLRRATQQREPG